MQILKDEIKDAILASARDEFFSKNYSAASMRTIAQNANVTVGNLYRYFKKKEDILDAVIMPVYAKLIDGIEHEEKSIKHVSQEEIDSLLDTELHKLVEFITSFRKEIVILFEKTNHTKYEKLKEEVIRHYSQHIISHLQLENIQYRDPGFKHIPNSLAASFIEGLLHMIKAEDDQSILYTNMLQFTSLFIKGFIDFLKTR